MKNLVFLICFTILLKPIIPVFDYIVNYEYIKTERCVNKETPIRGCNGKCYLMKNLAAAAEAEKPISSNKKHLTEIVDLYFADCTDLGDAFLSDADFPTLNSRYSNHYCKLDTVSVFHPPTVIS